MEITVKKLTPELAEEYACFFDVTPHATGKEEHRCYCVWWSSGDIDAEPHDSVEERRSLAKKWISEGYIQGYLAYCGDKVVGWCNANTKQDCYNSFCWRYFMGDIHKDAPTVKVKSVYCFAVAPEMRGKGVATALLRQVCADAEKDGFDFVEAYPNKDFINTEHDFMGPASIYEKLGFVPLYEVDAGQQNGQLGQKLVVRKALK